MINDDKIILGGEESAGLSIRGHYPEKDGILACLLAAEAVAARGVSLTEQLNELYGRVGRLEAGRIGVRLTPEILATLPEKLKRDPAEIGGRRVARTNRMDGVKFIFADGSWLLLRPSGTEPLVRIYAESESEKELEVLLEQGRNIIGLLRVSTRTPPTRPSRWLPPRELSRELVGRAQGAPSCGLILVCVFTMIMLAPSALRQRYDAHACRDAQRRTETFTDEYGSTGDQQYERLAQARGATFAGA